jgi:hypothetical protein
LHGTCFWYNEIMKKKLHNISPGELNCEKGWLVIFISPEQRLKFSSWIKIFVPH